jgi:hypothetical protein
MRMKEALQALGAGPGVNVAELTSSSSGNTGVETKLHSRPEAATEPRPRQG